MEVTAFWSPGAPGLYKPINTGVTRSGVENARETGTENEENPFFS